jgi:hypothetical protein
MGMYLMNVYSVFKVRIAQLDNKAAVSDLAKDAKTSPVPFARALRPCPA